MEHPLPLYSPSPHQQYPLYNQNNVYVERDASKQMLLCTEYSRNIQGKQSSPRILTQEGAKIVILGYYGH